ncbi:MAG TPA: SMC-Scp complex subunit ScpB [Rubrobacteraceae bacterium]|nr:SMC-Scp complex subunit ScpB [Rubrobacteraceae bacterium]
MRERAEHTTERRSAASPRPAYLVEAVLFASARPVSPAALAAATGLPDGALKAALAELEARYSPDNSGIVLRNVARGYLLSTNPACAPAVERFRDEARPAPLSGAAHEVLSSALYLGPVTRAGISRVRGVNSDAVVRNLLERGLLAEVGVDADHPGSPALLDVTDEFLTAAGAASREDFAPLDSLVSPEELSRLRERVLSATDPPAEAP